MPSFSIIIPTYQRPGQLGDCLRAIAALDYPRDRFEVIVVDDGGTGTLGPVIASAGAGLRISLLHQPNAGPAAARNTGARQAGYDLLAFTDDDCRPEPGWLRELARVLAEHPGCMAGGHTTNVSPGVCSAVSQLIVDVVYRHYNTDPTQARFLASNNMVLSARGFHEVGGFDPAFRTAEDRDLCDRWIRRGRRIVYSSAARVRHSHALGPREFCRQHFAYGRGAERFLRARRSRGSGGLMTELRFHLDVANWIGYPLRRVPWSRVPAVAMLLGVWQVANLGGFLWERIRRLKGALGDGAVTAHR